MAWDGWLLSLANEHRTSARDTLFATITWAGSLYVLVPLALAGALWLRWQRYAHEASFLIAALAGGSVLAHLGKLLVARPRPALFEVLGAMPLDHAFPSAHSAQITSFSLALFLILHQRRVARSWSLGMALALGVMLVAASRIYLQVHFPSDVVVGLAIGGLWVLGLAALMLRHAQDSYAQ